MLTYHPVHTLFERQVEKTPNEMALVSADVKLNYHELNQLANQLADCLYQLSQKHTATSPLKACQELDHVTRQTLFDYSHELPRPILIVCQQTQAEYLVALLASWKCGLPVILFDPNSISNKDIGRFMPQAGVSAAQAEFQQLVADFEPWLVMGDGAFTADTPDSIHLNYQISAHGLANVRVSVDFAVDALSHDNPQHEFPPNRLAMYVFTSGSTGQPKAMAQTQAGIAIRINSILDDLLNVALAQQQQSAIGVGDVFLQFCSLRFDGSLGEIFFPLTRGATLRLLEKSKQRDLVQYFDKNDRYAPNCFVSLPTAYQDCVAQLETNPDVRDMFCHYKLILTTGTDADPDAIRVMKTINPQLTVIDGWGPAEGTIGCIGAVVSQGKPLYEQQIVLKGVAIETAQLDPYTIVDDQARLQFSAAVNNKDGGELIIIEQPLRCLQSSQPLMTMTLGYVTKRKFDHELNRQKFILDGRGFCYRTGDLAVVHQPGQWQYLGRLDQQVQLAGTRTELTAVQKWFAEQFQELKNLSFTVKQRGKQTINIIIQANAEVDQPWLRKQLIECEERFDVNFYYSLSLDGGKPVDFEIYQREAITGAAEQIVANCFARVLGCEVNSLHRYADFELLGGDSIKYVRLRKLLQDEFNLPVFPVNQHLLKINRIARYCVLTRAMMDHFECLTPVKENAADLFCFYPISGDGNVFRAAEGGQQEIFADLMPNVNVYALDSLEAKGRSLEYQPRDIKERAYYIAQAMVQMKPSGALYLYGWSYGARLSYWVSKALKAMGKQDITVFLLDPIRPNYDVIHDQVSTYQLADHQQPAQVLLYRVFEKLIDFPHSNHERFYECVVGRKTNIQQAFAERYAFPSDCSTDDYIKIVDSFFQQCLVGLRACDLNPEEYAERARSFSATHSNIRELLQAHEPEPLDVETIIYFSAELCEAEQERVKACYPGADHQTIAATDHFTLLRAEPVQMRLSDELLNKTLRQAADSWKTRLPVKGQYYHRRGVVTQLLTELDQHTGQEVFQLILHGLSGVGKTQILIDILHELKTSRPCFFFSANNIEQQFLEFAQINKLVKNNDVAAAIAAVKDFFESNPGWFIAFDNINDTEVVNKFFPRRGGCIMATSTQSQVAGLYGRRIDSPTVTNEKDFLLTIARGYGLQHESDTDQAILKLCNTFSGLPVALAQVAIYINLVRQIQADYTIEQFLSSYNDLSDCAWVKLEYHRALLQQANPSLQPSIFVTTKLLMERLSDLHPDVLTALERCSYVDSHEIPAELLQADNPAFRLITMKELLGYLVEIREGRNIVINCHPMFHLALKVWFRDGGQLTSANQVLHFLSDRVGHYQYELATTWSGMIRYAHHVGVFIRNYIQYRELYQIETFDDQFMSLIFPFLNYEGKARANFGDVQQLGQMVYQELGANEQTGRFSNLSSEQYLQFAASMCYSHLGSDVTPQRFVQLGSNIISNYDELKRQGVTFSDGFENDVYNLRIHVPLCQGQFDKSQGGYVAAIQAYLKNDLETFGAQSFAAFRHFQGESDQYKLQALYALSLHVAGQKSDSKKHFRGCLANLREYVVQGVARKLCYELQQLCVMYQLYKAMHPNHDPKLSASLFHNLAMLVIVEGRRDPSAEYQEYIAVAKQYFRQATACYQSALNSYEQSNFLILNGEAEAALNIIKSTQLCGDEFELCRDVGESPIVEPILATELAQQKQLLARIKFLACYQVSRIYPTLPPAKQLVCLQLLGQFATNLHGQTDTENLLIQAITQSEAYQKRHASPASQPRSASSSSTDRSGVASLVAQHSNILSAPPTSSQAPAADSIPAPMMLLMGMLNAAAQSQASRASGRSAQAQQQPNQVMMQLLQALAQPQAAAQQESEEQADENGAGERSPSLD